MIQRPELLRVVRREVAVVLGEAEDDIGEGTDLRDSYDLDSLELMEIGARLEKALGCRLDAKLLMTVRTVGDAVDVIRTGLAGAS